MSSPPKKLSAQEVRQRLLDASDVLGTEPAETVAANTTIKAARIALLKLSVAFDLTEDGSAAIGPTVDKTSRM